MPGPGVEGNKNSAYYEVGSALHYASMRRGIPGVESRILKKNAVTVRTSVLPLKDNYEMWRMALEAKRIPLGTPLKQFANIGDHAAAAVYEQLFTGRYDHIVRPALTEEHDAHGSRMEDPRKVGLVAAEEVLVQLGIITRGVTTAESGSHETWLLAKTAHIDHSITPTLLFDRDFEPITNHHTGETLSVGRVKGERVLTVGLRKPLVLGPLVSIEASIPTDAEIPTIALQMKVDQPDFNDPQQAAAFRRLIAAD